MANETVNFCAVRRHFAVLWFMVAALGTKFDFGPGRLGLANDHWDRPMVAMIALGISLIAQVISPIKAAHTAVHCRLRGNAARRFLYVPFGRHGRAGNLATHPRHSNRLEPAHPI